MWGLSPQPQMSQPGTPTAFFFKFLLLYFHFLRWFCFSDVSMVLIFFYFSDNINFFSAPRLIFIFTVHFLLFVLLFSFMLAFSLHVIILGQPFIFKSKVLKREWSCGQGLLTSRKLDISLGTHRCQCPWIFSFGPVFSGKSSFLLPTYVWDCPRTVGRKVLPPLGREGSRREGLIVPRQNFTHCHCF